MARTTPLRERYEADVRALADLAAQLADQGVEIAQIARTLHKRRRAIGLRYKLRTPLWGNRGQIAIYRRNWHRYGHPLGPSITSLRRRGRTWDEICASACRPGGEDLS